LLLCAGAGIDKPIDRHTAATSLTALRRGARRSALMETLLAQHSCVARPAATPRQPRRVACLSGRQLHGLPLRPAGVPAAALGGSAHGRRGAGAAGWRRRPADSAPASASCRVFHSVRPQRLCDICRALRRRGAARERHVEAGCGGGRAAGTRYAPPPPLRANLARPKLVAPLTPQAAAVPASAQQIVRVFRTPGLTDAKAAALLKKVGGGGRFAFPAMWHARAVPALSRR
jgi:hypothetical protein